MKAADCMAVNNLIQAARVAQFKLQELARTFNSPNFTDRHGDGPSCERKAKQLEEAIVKMEKEMHANTSQPSAAECPACKSVRYVMRVSGQATCWRCDGKGTIPADAAVGAQGEQIKKIAIEYRNGIIDTNEMGVEIDNILTGGKE